MSGWVRCVFCGQRFVGLSRHLDACRMRADYLRSISCGKRVRDAEEKVAKEYRIKTTRLAANVKIKDDVLKQQAKQIADLQKLLAEKPTTVNNITINIQQEISKKTKTLKDIESKVLKMLQWDPYIRADYKGAEGVRRLLHDIRRQLDTNPEHREMLQIMDKERIETNLPEVDSSPSRCVIVDTADEVESVIGTKVLELVELTDVERTQLEEEFNSKHNIIS